MTTYAIGDVQGCFDALQALLEKIRFDPAHDVLWFTGDLVNRGPQSLETLRFVKGPGRTRRERPWQPRPAPAGGSHRGRQKRNRMRSMKSWRRTTVTSCSTGSGVGHCCITTPRSAGRWCMPGCCLQWDLADARRLAREAEIVLQSDHADDFLAHMYGDLPDHWREDLTGHERLRVIVNAFTRLRYCDPGARWICVSRARPAASRRIRSLVSGAAPAFWRGAYRVRSLVHAGSVPGPRCARTRRRLPLGSRTLWRAPQTGRRSNIERPVP